MTNLGWVVLENIVLIITFLAIVLLADGPWKFAAGVPILFMNFYSKGLK